MIELSLKLNTVWVASNAGASWVGLCYKGAWLAKTNGPKQKLAGREVVMKACLPAIYWPLVATTTSAQEAILIV
jgi:hypothetical protein